MHKKVSVRITLIIPNQQNIIFMRISSTIKQKNDSQAILLGSLFILR